jgi:hypothetical protein
MTPSLLDIQERMLRFGFVSGYAIRLPFIGNKFRVPHISLVFREMWGTRDLLRG